ncbi:MAG: acetoin utilization protein AcuC [Actinobacteria bacterium]|nr:acetoin utilization protein AcuC [Actinomycetota bacterium]
MRVILPYSQQMAEYDFGPMHPMRPERFTLALDLMYACGYLCDGDSPSRRGARANIVEVEAAEVQDLSTVHSRAYIDTVMDASKDPARFSARRGIGTADTPAFHQMHETAALICGATIEALRAVVEGDARSSLSIAGGLHHAHRESASGFCIYNDPACAIAVMTRDHPGLRVAYIDIDAHHGDGVEGIFYDSPDVLTISVHESGRYLFPGTGRVLDTGVGAGKGYALNVPLPPLADDACYRLVLREVIAPAIAAFKPDVIVAQCGADALHTDQLTHLGLTLSGYSGIAEGLVQIAEEVCGGRLCATGGGGYDAYLGTPRAWTLLLAAMLKVDPDPLLPEKWRSQVQETIGEHAPFHLLDDSFAPIGGVAEKVRAQTASVVERVRQASPLLR